MDFEHNIPLSLSRYEKGSLPVFYIKSHMWTSARHISCIYNVHFTNATIHKQNSKDAHMLEHEILMSMELRGH